jgi:PEP-CTERM motif
MFSSCSSYRNVNVLAASMALAAGLALATPAKATVLSFELLNYSAANGGKKDGGAGLPNYCVRMDNILGIGSPATFSCEAVGAGMQLDYDDNNTTGDTTDDTIRIFGIVFGGKDDGTTYDPNNSGFAAIDFTYAANIIDVGGPGTDLKVNPENSGNTGTIQFGTDASWNASVQGETVALQDEDGGKGFSFQFNNYTDQKGMPSTLSTDADLYHGQGWMNYGVPDATTGRAPHVAATDWLFIARIPTCPPGAQCGPTQVSEPGTLALFGLGLLGLGVLRRRRRPG